MEEYEKLKLSITVTLCFFSSKNLQSVEPMYPAPPVISTFICPPLLFLNSLILCQAFLGDYQQKSHFHEYS